MHPNLDELTAELLTGPELLAAAQLAMPKTGGLGNLVATPQRELSVDDIVAADVTTGTNPSQPPKVKRLRSSHHKLARLLALGYREQQCALLTGYCSSRISILQADPAFAELVSYYRQHVDDGFTDTIEKMSQITNDALDLIHERLEEEPESITTMQAVEIVKSIGDRAGHSPVAKSQHTEVIIDAAELSKIKQRVKEKQIGQVRQITQTPAEATHRVLSQPDGIQEDRGPAVGAEDRPAELVRQEATRERFPRQGLHLRTHSGAEA